MVFWTYWYFVIWLLFISDLNENVCDKCKQIYEFDCVSCHFFDFLSKCLILSFDGYSRNVYPSVESYLSTAMIRCWIYSEGTINFSKRWVKLLAHIHKPSFYEKILHWIQTLCFQAWLISNWTWWSSLSAVLFYFHFITPWSRHKFNDI